MVSRLRPRGRGGARGQSLVEFALVAPIMIFMMLAIVDLSRVFTAMLTVESAAREAADFGAFSSSDWSGDRLVPESNRAKVEAGMLQRACVAASTLPDFSASGATCTNPSMAPPQLIDEDGNLVDDDRCANPNRNTPCRVRVDLSYKFKLIAPLGFDFFGVRLGLPSELSFTRTSVFAISDFKIDQKPSP